MKFENFKNTEFYKKSDFTSDFESNYQEIDNWLLLAKQFDNWLNTKETNENYIPHIIHQIWLGSPFPDKYRNWATSWTKQNVDYEYKLWTEETLVPLMTSSQVNWFKSMTNFGSKSDFARLLILSIYGGIYCDTDFECIQSFDVLCSTSTFFSGTMFNVKPEITNALIGAIPHHPFIDKMLSEITNTQHNTNKTIEILGSTGPGFLTRCYFENQNLLNKNDVILPSHYLFPYPSYCIDNNLSDTKIKEIYLKTESLAIHYWDQSWMIIDSKFLKILKSIIKKIIFYDYFKKLKKKSK